jgi:hypothetical protein
VRAVRLATIADMAKDRSLDRSATRVRAIRVSDDLWIPALEKAEANGETVADVVRRALADYTGVDASGVRGRDGGRDTPSVRGKR